MLTYTISFPIAPIDSFPKYTI